jgi:hypothetical protein
VFYLFIPQGTFGFFYLLTIVNNGVMNMGIQIPVCVLAFGYTLRSGLEVFFFFFKSICDYRRRTDYKV